MNIYFINDGKESVAFLSYNFKEIEDSVLVSFRDKWNEDILFSKSNGEWNSVCDLQTRNPATYLNIQKAILKHFRENDMFNDFKLSQFLS